jgi:hypothetical protein
MSGRLMIKEGIAPILIKYQAFRWLRAVRLKFFVY